MEDFDSSLHELGCNLRQIKNEIRATVEERLRCDWQGYLFRVRVSPSQTMARTYAFMARTNDSCHIYIQGS